MSLSGFIRSRLSRTPLDWSRGAGRPLVAAASSVDIIIPIYGAFEDLERCLASVEAHTDLKQHGVILVLDGPQASEVETLVSTFGSRGHRAVSILRNETRLGFAATVNHGMQESGRDVILLNTDTIVTARWVEKMIAAAYSDGDIGTVTPLSNHATLCSVPRPFAENLLPAGLDAEAFAGLIERVSLRAYPRLPTGVGFCFYIRRALLDDIGLFDVEHYAAGYGEENDFCLRALARGWLHVVDDATFIHHAGNRSFGSARHERQRAATATLDQMHPRYRATIARFMRVDPLAPVRERIVSALRGPGAEGNTHRKKIVHLVHGWPPAQQAGTELYAYWLVRQQTSHHDVAVYVRAANRAAREGDIAELMDEGVRVRMITNNFTARNPLRRNAIRDRAIERDFERFLREEQPDLLHVHHLAGHAFSLVHVAKRLGIPIVLQIQDWWFVCARVNLFHRNGGRCSGPSLAKCAACATLTRVPPMRFWNTAMHLVRRNAARSAIRACNAYIAGSQAIRSDYMAARFIPPAKEIHVLPYGVAIQQNNVARTAARRPVRFGYVGSISPHKGVHTAVEAMLAFTPETATLRIWGDVSALPDYVTSMKAAAGNADVRFEGRFAESEKPRVFSEIDVLIVPSIGLESFGLAPREAMMSGIPVLATRGGALSEMFPPGLCGDYFDAGDAEALRTLMRRVVDDPSIIDKWAAAIPPPQSSGAHALEIERVYDEVLAGRA